LSAVILHLLRYPQMAGKKKKETISKIG